MLAHGDGESAGIIVGYDEMIMGYLEHSDDERNRKMVMTVRKLWKRVSSHLQKSRKTAAYAIIGQALEDGGAGYDESKGGDGTMKHNVFDNSEKNEKGNFLSHADQEAIIKMAKTSYVGTFKTALEIYENDNALQHDAIASGFNQSGDGNVTWLFPEYKRRQTRCA